MPRLLLSVTIALAVSLASAQANCFPPSTSYPAPTRASPPAVDPASNKKGAAFLYLDASASMEGFVQSGTSGRTAARSGVFEAVEAGLPGILDETSSDVSFFRVGKSVDPIPKSTTYLASHVAFYCPKDALDPKLRVRWKKEDDDYYRSRCMAGSQSNGFQTESRIDQVIDVIAGNADPGAKADLSVVVTDLFLSAAEMDSSYGAKFRQAIGSILQSGQGAMVVALSASFTGRLFDLPTFGSNAGPLHDGSRPFFLLAFGDPAKLEFLRTRLQEELTPFGQRIESQVFHTPPIRSIAGSGIALRTAAQAAVTPRGFNEARAFDKLEALTPQMRDMLASDYDALQPGFPTLVLPLSSRPYAQQALVTITVPSALVTSGIPGTLQLYGGQTFRIDEAGTCPGAWVRVFPDTTEAERPIMTPTSIPATGKVVLSLLDGKDGTVSKAVEARLGLVSRVGFLLHRVQMRWVPDTARLGAAAPSLPDWVSTFGFEPFDEARVLKAGFEAMPKERRGGTAQRPTKTGGLFPALNLPEIIRTLSRIEWEQKLVTPSVELGTFVVGWRFD